MRLHCILSIGVLLESSLRVRLRSTSDQNEGKEKSQADSLLVSKKRRVMKMMVVQEPCIN